MMGVVLLFVALAGFTALALYLDSIAYDPFDQYRTDPRDLVDRAHEWEGRP